MAKRTMKEILNNINEDLKVAAADLLGFKEVSNGKVTIDGQEFDVHKNMIVTEGDFYGMTLNAAKKVIPVCKDENGDWKIEALIMPCLAKSIVYTVDGSLSRDDAFVKVDRLITGADFDLSGDVQGMFDNLIVNQDGIKAVEETVTTLGYSSAELRTAHTGGVYSDVYDINYYQEELKHGSDQFFSIDWESIQD